MSEMFYGCSSLHTPNLSKFDTSKVTDMQSMFYSCFNMHKLDLSSFDTSNVTNMGSMFTWCEFIKFLDISSFDTSKVENMQSMFEGCMKLNNVLISDTFVGNALTEEGIKYLFDGCYDSTSKKLGKALNIKSPNGV